MFVGITPVRISFAGGGTDMPEYYEKFAGSVVSTSISKFTYSIIQFRQDNLFQFFSPDFQKHYKPTEFSKIEHQKGTEMISSVIKNLNFKKGTNIMIFSDVPAGSGLGGSSSLMVNLVKTISTINRDNLSKEEVAEKSFYIARKILKWPVGKQDEYISSHGGFKFINFSKEKIRVNQIKIKKRSLIELQQNLLLFFIGNTRNSSPILIKQIENIKNMQKDTLSSLHHVNNLSQEMYRALNKSDISKFGELLHKGWILKKKFTKNVTNKRIDKIYDVALKNGAIGGKITGAGCGGHMLFYCEIKKQNSLLKKMESLGLKKINFNFYNQGPKITESINFLKKSQT